MTTPTHLARGFPTDPGWAETYCGATDGSRTSWRGFATCEECTTLWGVSLVLLTDLSRRAGEVPR